VIEGEKEESQVNEVLELEQIEVERKSFHAEVAKMLSTEYFDASDDHSWNRKSQAKIGEWEKDAINSKGVCVLSH